MKNKLLILIVVSLLIFSSVDAKDFIIRNESNGVPYFVLNGSNGNIGIGTTTPQRILHVNGSILSNSTINATGDICIEGGVCLSAAGTGDNSSWNETHADTKYLFQSEESNLDVNSSNYWEDLDTYNLTQMENNGGTLNIILSWFSTQFDSLFGAKDTDDLTQGSSNLYDNQTWSESLADTLYVPYTGANQNLDLGVNNFSVDSDVLFVDSNNDGVGIGTTSPTKKFEVNGTAGAFNVDPDNSGGPLLDTTAGNVTITSSGGSVIIKLG